ncbi:N-acetylmuramoyl-L-alanine amidase CwlD [Anaerocolumna cellulosilytica]|uniref:N-acetylmuramoyl-L-alanine amidase CwlD n=1 Tax=Anaerocolumna cellulosilytica TaxID=433286 RepID=A0A6S6RDC6_9FIRM|nr:N-acetylmuramoyl-L-alanine amidase [Anaerocolumna cellulosilytica]MBB5195248.1 N-acetylmuramoyl-L-alanine amidase [Anaerocolumna cellulosilytica]BCJ96721.1 N-acetylmuramoyl-L-alanine amidase CwlD [Anaerocolumna cellulosilytica]
MSSRLQKLNKNYFHILFLLMVCLSVLILTDNTVIVMQQTGEFTTNKKEITMVIDAGHGGRDPGKVGINGAQEKDVNLSIALKLKALLEQNDIKVIMTRVEDIGLYAESDSNKKVADMRKRVDIINSSRAELAISIHQNSFTQESIRGAQVFYYTNSVEGKSYAEIMQAQMKETLQDGNKRVAKSNDSYYMLKKVECPIVIMECGYLSNRDEAALLIDEAYQERLAWAIHLGLMRYINTSVSSAQ